MRHNPLVAPILHILRTAETGLSEYELMRRIEANGDLVEVNAAGPQLGLYRKHFMVMNALYALQAELATENVYLQISALSIAISRGACESAGTGLTDQVNVKLSEYYLDWRHYDETGEADVQRLLDGFWQRYAATDKQQLALQILGLSRDADWPMIRDCYRRLAGQHHPDKGGDDRKFIEVREAYEILRCCYDCT